MISSVNFFKVFVQNYVFASLLLASNTVIAGLIFMPGSGVSIDAELGKISQDSIIIKPYSNQTTAVRYHLQSLQSNDYSINTDRLRVKTLYTIGAESLDLYRTFLSGSENSNQITAEFEFEPQWSDAPGTYNGSLTSTSDVPLIPVKITIVPKSVVSILPTTFDIASSSIDAPIINEVNVMLGSNSPNWELYLQADNFINNNNDERKINSDRVFVRIKNDINPQPWLALDQTLKIISGVATPVTTIATLEFVVISERADMAGEYLGNIKFLVRNIN